MIVDSAIYVDGRRSAPCSLEGTHDACQDWGGFAWIGLYEPTEEDLQVHRVTQPLTEAFRTFWLVMVLASRGVASETSLENGRERSPGRYTSIRVR